MYVEQSKWWWIASVFGLDSGRPELYNHFFRVLPGTCFFPHVSYCCTVIDLLHLDYHDEYAIASFLLSNIWECTEYVQNLWPFRLLPHRLWHIKIPGDPPGYLNPVCLYLLHKINQRWWRMNNGIENSNCASRYEYLQRQIRTDLIPV